MSASTHFAGSAGQYHVAYCLAVRHFHAVMTMGNAPSVDIIASNTDGSRTIALQVKTSSGARKTSYGHKCREWRSSSSLGQRASPRLWFALVDLQASVSADAGAVMAWNPQVYLVPSLWVAEFVRVWGPGFYQLLDVLWPECEERWDRVTSFMNDDPEISRWCSSVPPEAVEWPGIEPKPRH